MKKINLFALATISLITLNSCGEDKKNQSAEEGAMPMQNDTRMESEDASGNLDDGKETSTPEFKNENLAAVYEDYLDLKSALVNSEASDAKASSEELVKSLEQTEGGESALEAAKKIASNEDIKEQRTAFSDLSAAVETMLAGNLASGEVYKQYCPMAFDGAGGYWLSSSEEVRNPYYGDMMLKCGRVEDTIK